MVVVLIFGGFIIGAVSGLIYLYTRFLRFLMKYRWKDHWADKKWMARLIAAIPIVCLLLYCVLDLVNGVIVTVNILAIWLIADFLDRIVRMIRKRDKKPEEAAGMYWAGVGAILFSAVYLGSGWYFAHHVYETDYVVKTDKGLGADNFRIVQVSDSHVGCTFDGEGFAAQLERIQGTEPDILVITGDFVDDDTSREDMIKCCEALGKFQTKYGIYFVYGNHDKGYFDRRDFKDEDLRAELLKNHVTILEDEAVMIGENICLIGRKDRSMPERADMDTLMREIDPARYVVVLDHQPHDFQAQADVGADLVLCGHTHGGQMFPVGITGELSGANDKTYGLEIRNKTTFIVNSGISDWAIRYKTGGAIAEFGVIDIRSE